MNTCKNLCNAQHRHGMDRAPAPAGCKKYVLGALKELLVCYDTSEVARVKQVRYTDSVTAPLLPYEN